MKRKATKGNPRAIPSARGATRMPNGSEAQIVGFKHFQKYIDPELHRRMKADAKSDSDVRKEMVGDYLLPDPHSYPSYRTGFVGVSHLALYKLADVLCLYEDYRLAGECLYIADFLNDQLSSEERIRLDAEKGMKFPPGKPRGAAGDNKKIIEELLNNSGGNSNQLYHAYRKSKPKKLLKYASFCVALSKIRSARRPKTINE